MNQLTFEPKQIIKTLWYQFLSNYYNYYIYMDTKIFYEHVIRLNDIDNQQVVDVDKYQIGLFQQPFNNGGLSEIKYRQNNIIAIKEKDKSEWNPTMLPLIKLVDEYMKNIKYFGNMKIIEQYYLNNKESFINKSVYTVYNVFPQIFEITTSKNNIFYIYTSISNKSDSNEVKFNLKIYDPKMMTKNPRNHDDEDCSKCNLVPVHVNKIPESNNQIVIILSVVICILCLIILGFIVKYRKTLKKLT